MYLGAVVMYLTYVSPLHPSETEMRNVILTHCRQVQGTELTTLIFTEMSAAVRAQPFAGR